MPRASAVPTWEKPPPTAEAAKPLPVPMALGAVLVYDTRLWHRGGANRSRRKRPVFYLGLLDEGQRRLPPAGLPYTIEPDEIGCFVLSDGGGGVTPKPTKAAARLGRCAFDTGL